jgi:hypothetical protein
MKRMSQWVLAAILTISGSSVFTACSSHDDNPAPKPSDLWDAATGTLYVNSNPGKSAYEGRTDIVSVFFSDAVTSIGDRAFYNCPISVVDLPASVVSIGNEAFAGEDSDLEKVTIYATDCTFGEHPFVQSILTNVYVPAASLESYKASYPGYKSQIYAIPEVELDGNEIIWSEDLCEYIWVGIPYYHKDRIVAAHNTQGGITVNFAITDENSGLDIGCISLVQGEKLTFTSAVGNISKITIQTDPYEEDDEENEPDTPVAEGWKWDAAKHTFTWQGTPSAAVEMLAGGDVNLESVQISFTIDGSAPSPDTMVLTEWQAGKTVDAATVEAYGGIDKCFAAEPIPDGVWALMQGKTFKENPYIGRDDLRHVRALHWDYDNQMHVGEMVCNVQIADCVTGILRQLFDAKYPIQRMLLPDVYDADDETQMRDNNSSCFCYRNIAGSTNLSKHARGLAIDINTLYNPYFKVRDDGTLFIQPATAEAYCNRDWDFPYKIDHDDLCFKLFTEAGFEWGGDWTTRKDYQHFEVIE